MGTALDKLTIQGFKSIRELNDFKLKKLNVIVGANGAGKSNFISFFRMLHALIEGNLNRYVRDSGGAGDLLFQGRKTTQKMFFETHFGSRGYRFTLVPTPADGCAIENEGRYYSGGTTGWWELGDSDDGKSLLAMEVLENNLMQHIQNPSMRLSLRGGYIIFMIPVLPRRCVITRSFRIAKYCGQMRPTLHLF